MNKPTFHKPASNPSSPETQKANKPVHELRIGSVKASIWANAYEDNIVHNVTFSRIYKSGDEWRRSESFGRDDLLVVAKLADLAHSWICDQHANRPNK